MTLSLDDVRTKRFRMARKSGYEVLEVDEFVDEVETSFEQLLDENENLKTQVEALKASPSDPAADRPAVGAGDGRRTIVVTTGKEASTAVVRLVEMSTEQAERLVDEATEDANRIREEASRSAQEVTADARTRAERIESDARITAEKAQGDALGRADALDQETEAKRTAMFSGLESERDKLQQAVAELRDFEASFRGTLVAQLRGHIEQIEQSKAEPDVQPSLAAAPPQAVAAESSDADAETRPDPDPTAEPATSDSATGGTEADVPDDADQREATDDSDRDGGSPRSDTPRLDALLGEQR